MTTLGDSLLTGDCDDLRVSAHIKDCQDVLKGWSDEKALAEWERISEILSECRRSVMLFRRDFRGVDTKSDAQLLSRLFNTMNSMEPSDGQTQLLALGVLVSTRKGDIEGALLLLVDLKEKEKLLNMQATAQNMAHSAARALVGLRLHLEWLLSNAPHFKRGKKIVSGARKGHEIAHGTKTEKEKRKAAYKATVNALYEQHPHWSWTQISEEAGKIHGKSGKTIRNHVDNPTEAANEA